MIRIETHLPLSCVGLLHHGKRLMKASDKLFRSVAGALSPTECPVPRHLMRLGLLLLSRMLLANHEAVAVAYLVCTRTISPFPVCVRALLVPLQFPTAWNCLTIRLNACSWQMLLLRQTEG